MRDSDRDPLRIQHMLEAANNVIQFMEGKSLQDLQNNKLLFFAVVKNIEIIGEAAFMLTKEFKNNNPVLPWRQIEGMRHVLVHEYFQISPIQVFNVFKEDIPILLPVLRSLNNTKTT